MNVKRLNTPTLGKVFSLALTTSLLSSIFIAPFIAPAALANQEAAEQHENGQAESHVQQAQLPLQELRNFTEIFDRIRNSYVEEVDDKTLLEYAINGMLTNLDPHSDYLLPEDFSDLQENTTGKFGGLGIEVGVEDGYIKVISPIDDTPAEEAGIKAGDLIVILDGEPVRDMSLSAAVERMRGEPGTDITLSIRREGEQEFLEFTLTRAEIKVASVRGESLSKGIGYLRVTQFQEKSGQELNKAIKKLQKKDGELSGLVLDLRNNPGGVLDAAVEISDAFLDSGLIVYTEGRIEESDLRYSATHNTIASEIPLVVLINGGSASASEIVAGALQDHNRAVILGTQSFGKGSVQSVLPIAGNKAIKLTTARYFTPSGRSIQAQGIKPDVLVEQSEVTSFEQNYYKESDLPGHLSNGEESGEKSGEEEGKKSAGDKKVASDIAADLLSEDFQLYQAYTMLKGWAVFQKPDNVATGKDKE